MVQRISLGVMRTIVEDRSGWLGLIVIGLIVGLTACDDDNNTQHDASVTTDSGVETDTTQQDSVASADTFLTEIDTADSSTGTVDDTGSDVVLDSSDSDVVSTVPIRYARCPYVTRSGRFTVDLKSTSTTINGVVANGVVPQNIPVVSLAEGDCSLLVPPTLFCDPACEPGFTCDGTGRCIPYPTNQSVGKVTFSGLSADVMLNPIPPQQIYYFAGNLPHPGFEPGVTVGLNAEGADHDPFSLAARGITPMVAISDVLPFDPESPATLQWEADTPDPAVFVFVTVNIANHGGAPARIECLTADRGELTIPKSLVEALLTLGYSGFPSVQLSRESVTATDTPLGCIELLLQSEVVLDVAIDGLISCSGDEDCPDGQSCQLDLVCK